MITRMRLSFTLILSILSSLSLFAQSYTTTCDTTSIYDATTENAVCIDTMANIVGIFSNNYPDSSYTSFTFSSGAAVADVTAEDNEYYFCHRPQPANYFTYTGVNSTNPNGSLTCPGYTFGILLNGIVINPGAGIYYEENSITYEEWEITALSQTLGWDDNNAHKQSDGLYHYHGDPEVYADSLGIDGMSHSSIIGWAADGYPIYYKYVFSDRNDMSSSVVELSSCWTIRSGDRSTLGYSVYPTGNFDGEYIADYEYGAIGSANCELDSANGRWARTPEFPNGTYHYVITANWPFVPRYFKGTPDVSFRKGANSCSNSTTTTDCSFMPYNVTSYLPVELMTFTGEAIESYNLLEWSTASEHNHSHFEIERSTNGFDFGRLDNVASNHFSSTKQNYSFYDFDTHENIYYYRLKMVDYDGYSEYSKIIMVTNSNNNVVIGEFQPNVITRTGILPLKTDDNELISIEIISTHGQILRNETYHLDEGFHTLEIDFNELPPQLYFVLIKIGEDKIVKRILKQ